MGRATSSSAILYLHLRQFTKVAWRHGVAQAAKQPVGRRSVTAITIADIGARFQGSEKTSVVSGSDRQLFQALGGEYVMT